MSFFLSNAQMYSATRRQREYNLNLSGPEADASAIAGAETAAFFEPGTASHSVMVGVLTGALTFAVTRILEKWLFSSPSRSMSGHRRRSRR